MNHFISIPDTILPNGLPVPSFKVSRYPASAGAINPAGAPSKRHGDRQPHQAAIDADGYPWVDINYHDAIKAAEAAGYSLLKESQALAIAWLIAQQHENWTGGKVGEGSLFQGLHKDSVDCPMPASFTPTDPAERTWHVLPGGERIYHFSGNAYTWIFDDIHGDENGLVARRFEADDISLQAPHPSCEKGMGWRPDGSRDWSGSALIRGGCWNSGSRAGAFRLYYGWPGIRRGVDVGFRCTQP